MLLLIHIIVALASVVYLALMHINPASRRIWGAYVLMGSTLATGTYLTILYPQQLTKNCLAGITYLAVMSAILWSVRRRAQAQTVLE